MTFLNALMLFGLVAVAVPIIMHLFHRQRVSTVDFSSVIFIRDHHLQRSRALRLRELLVLLLRTLIILLMVLAFARPVVEGLAGALMGSGVEQRSVFAIVLDNSYSMGAGRYGDTPFAAARTEAGRIVDAMQQGDEGLIILTAAPPEAVPPVPTDRTASLAELVAEAEVSGSAGDIAGAVRLARRKLAGIVSGNKGIYVLSDLQRIDWENLAESVYATESEAASASRVPIYLYPFEAGERGQRQHRRGLCQRRSADPQPAGTVCRDIHEPEPQWGGFNPDRASRAGGADWTVPAARTGGADPASGAARAGGAARADQAAPATREVRLVINGRNRDSRQVTVGSGAAGSVQFNVVIDSPGRYTGYVELDEDDVAADNRRFFTLDVPEAFGVTAVGQSESRYFIEQVLKPEGGLVTPVDVRNCIRRRVEQRSE